ncbi:tetratricopeptide repeat-containing sulfotransferase family protein [Dokdonella sp.]|uniref:tetratricopeptide repeat-containing sulfotransferase family protein n=1 Tax=Dokdonella sp. TaxID=2291710 RepID=UPI001B0D385D|nr:tetratricopeptide repeat-containing sulfotransferase family protein [Dokdonella sp.]MBO9662001.1 sulfotransferase [Dokdonella sp.]
MTAALDPSTSGDRRLDGLGASALLFLRQGERSFDAGDYGAAERCFAQARREAPEHAEPMRLHALVLQRLQRPAEAVALLQQAVQRRPDDALIHDALGSALGEIGRTDAALDALRRACALDPGLASAWANLGNALTLAGRTEESEVPLRRALELAPALQSARFLLAEALMMLGRVEESAEQYRELLRRYPHSGQAWWGLANLKSVKLGTDDARELGALVQRCDLPDHEQLTARFALAKALDDSARHADAFHAYVEANAFARRGFRWDAAGFERWLERVTTSFERAAVEPPDMEFGREVVFIVGLPRSASTLTEQILAAHPQVEGASELVDLGVVIREESRRRARDFPDWVADADASDWRRLGERYLERTARWRTERPRFTDKAPSNWMLTAAIRRMLPGARIVDCRRDPVETCWSCFRQIFWREHEYSYRLEDLAAYWRRYDAAMRQWGAQWPTRIRAQVYEELLADPEAQTRALLEFCDLPFDSACLRPHEATRSVRTASAAQVRQPLRRDTARTARYGDLLDPLRRALGRGR